jgi:hypothetical protein
MPEATCSHLSQYPAGVEWPADVSLDHFLHCFGLDEQLEWWRRFRDAADRGTRCTIRDHAGHIAMLTHAINDKLQAVRVQDEYIGQQVAKLRELESDLVAGQVDDAAEAASRVQAILGIVSRSEEEGL